MTWKELLFEEGDFNQKVKIVNNLKVDTLMGVKSSLVMDIIANAGHDDRLRIDNDRRKGNDWNSCVEEVYTHKGKVYVMIYVQNTKTDTSYPEDFETFFRRGEYYTRDNRLGVGVDYKEGQKAEVMRSILLECIYQLWNKEVANEKVIEKLSHYSIINPILNAFYNENRMKYKEISKYSSRDDVALIKGYHAAKKVLDDYIRQNWKELNGKAENELQDIYKKVFYKAVDDFKKNFNYDEWRKNTTLWW